MPPVGLSVPLLCVKILQNRLCPSCPSLCFKARLKAKLKLSKWFLINLKIKVTFTRKVFNLQPRFESEFLDLFSLAPQSLTCVWSLLTINASVCFQIATREREREERRKARQEEIEKENKERKERQEQREKEREKEKREREQQKQRSRSPRNTRRERSRSKSRSRSPRGPRRRWNIAKSQLNVLLF